MGVLKAYWGLGIAKELLKAAIDWAASSGAVSKINLLVRTDNTPAINLYKNLGFVIEGKLTRDFKINGVYYESYYMGLCIG
jgi:RimJ/RimL family protein N-acetyltransferase